MPADPAELLGRGQAAAAIDAVTRLRGAGRRGVRLDVIEGIARGQLGEHTAAATLLSRAVAAAPNLASAWHALGQELRALGETEGAVEALERAAQLRPGDVGVHVDLGSTRQMANQPEGAAAAFDRARQLAPGDLRVAWQDARVLPIVGRDTQQLARFRARYRQRLVALDHAVAQASPAPTQDAVGASWDAFHLHYHGEPVVDEQRVLGRLTARLAAAACPEHAAPRRVPAPDPRGRLRVGFASSLLCTHTITVLFRGWMERLDREKFSVHIYHLGDEVDDTTRVLEACAEAFHHLPGAPLSATADAIASDQLHALIYPDLGMDRRVLRLAALRLAPVQAVSWGHPVTTGLPHIDYFLSGEAMESAAAEGHYTERLIRLPGLGIHLSPPPAPASRERGYFGLKDGETVLLVPQSPFKLLPRFDDLYAQLCARIPRARIVFIMSAAAQATRGVKDTLIGRFLAAFRRRGLDLTAHLHILPQLDHGDFLALNTMSDLFLDAPGWSGGRTTIEAASCGLLPVTLPGRLMRQRHTAGILNILGLPELIARDEADYVDIAVRAATDAPWRTELQTRLAGALPDFWQNEANVRALEAAIVKAVQQAQAQAALG